MIALLVIGLVLAAVFSWIMVGGIVVRVARELGYMNNQYTDGFDRGIATAFWPLVILCGMWKLMVLPVRGLLDGDTFREKREQRERNLRKIAEEEARTAKRELTDFYATHPEAAKEDGVKVHNAAYIGPDHDFIRTYYS